MQIFLLTIDKNFGEPWDYTHLRIQSLDRWVSHVINLFMMRKTNINKHQHDLSKCRHTLLHLFCAIRGSGLDLKSWNHIHGHTLHFILILLWLEHALWSTNMVERRGAAMVIWYRHKEYTFCLCLLCGC